MQRAKGKLNKVLIDTLRKTRKGLCSQGKKWMLQKNGIIRKGEVALEKNKTKNKTMVFLSTNS